MLDNFFFYINFIHENLENNFLIFFFIYFFSIIFFFSISLPGGLIPLILSGFFFGFYIGFIINILSIVIGSYFFVIIAEKFLKKFFRKMYFNLSKKLSNFIKNSNYEYLIIFRIIHGNPLFVQNLCISFLNISRWKLIISSFIGFTPTIIIVTYFGSKSRQIYDVKNINYADIFSIDFIFFIIVFILILILRIIYKNKKNNN